MSLQTWKEEFYKVPAIEVKNDKDAIDHSILKWTGLLPENLKKHECKLDNAGYGTALISIDSTQNYPQKLLMITGSTCALCKLHIDQEGHCQNCPLYMFLGNRCDEYDMPYRLFDEQLDMPVQPMLDALIGTKEAFDKGELEKDEE